MPSGPPELHAKWKNDGNAINFLESHGYKRTIAWSWIKPTPEYRPTEEEREAIYYLIVEWDWGGLLP